MAAKTSEKMAIFQKTNQFSPKVYIGVFEIAGHESEVRLIKFKMANEIFKVQPI